MSDKPRKVDCSKCGASFWYDSNTWCPRCDSNQNFGFGAHPDASKRIWELRQKCQAELQAQAQAHAQGKGS